MKREIRDIIENDVVIPDIVLQAKEDAFAKLSDDAQSVAESTKDVAGKKTRRKFGKKWVAIAAVAVLVVGTMSAGAAAGGFNSGLLKYMGITNLQPGDLKVASKKVDATFVAHGIDYKNNPAGVEKDVAVTITDVIGDETTAYFRIDFDYEMPEYFNMDDYSFWFERGGIRIYDEPEMIEEIDYPMDIDMQGRPIYEDGKLSIVYRIQGLDNLAEKYIHWEGINLWIFERDIKDEAYYNEVLFEGTWDMKFQLAYESEEPIVFCPDATITVEDAELVSVDDMDGERSIRDVDVKITEVEITPLCIWLYGEADFDPTMEEDLHFMCSLDKITYKDGTVLEYDYSNYTGSFKTNTVFMSYPSDNLMYSTNDIPLMFGKGVDLDKIESITINGVDIKVK